jgi:hypothetical protein
MKEVLLRKKFPFNTGIYVFTDRQTADTKLPLSAEGGKPKNMCEMLDKVEARGVEKGMAKGEDMVIALLRKLAPGSEDYNKALNASAEERRELYRKYGIA